VQFVEYPSQCTAPNCALCNNTNALVRRIVHNRQAFDRASVSTAIKHEIHRPNLIRLLRPYQWLTLTQRDLLALAFGHLQLRFAVQALHALVIDEDACWQNIK
jgi:hypothetical protein